MANEGYEHGIDWVQIDDDGGALGPLLNAALPPATVRASTLCYSRTGGRWWGCIVSNPLTSARAWALIGAGGGGGGDPDILFVVAQPAKYGAMAASVFTSLPLALAAPAVLAAAAAGGTSLLLLDDTYDVSAAPQTSPDNLRLFAFSAGGAIITSSAAAPTLVTLGNTKIENVSVENTGGAPAIRTNGNGALRVTGNVTINGDVDAATNGNAISFDVSGGATVQGSVLGGAGLLEVQNLDSFVSVVNGANGSARGHGGRYRNVLFSGPGLVQASDTTFGTIDTAGIVTLQGGTVSGAIGGTTPPSDLTLQECTTEDVVVAGDTIVRGSTIGTTMTAASLTFENSRANGDVTSSGKCDVRSSTIGGAMTSSGGSFESYRNTFVGAVSADGFADTESEFRSACTGTSAPSTFTGSYLFGVFTPAAATDSELRNCFVRVAVGATGAIANTGGTVDLIDCYVRADDTFVSVSGTGNVRTQGHIAGGCRFDVSGGLVVLTTTSDVRGRSALGIVAPLAVTADVTLDSLTGTAEVIDSVYLTPNQNGWNVQAYPAAVFPVGYRHFAKNVSTLFGVNLLPFGATDTIDGLTTAGGGGVTLGPNDFVELEKVSVTGWQTCS